MMIFETDFFILSIAAFCLSMSDGSAKEADIKRAMRNKITDISRLSRSKYKYVPLSEYPAAAWLPGQQTANSDPSSHLPGTSSMTFNTAADITNFVNAGTSFEQERQLRQFDCGRDIPSIPQRSIGDEKVFPLSPSLQQKEETVIIKQESTDDYH